MLDVLMKLAEVILNSKQSCLMINGCNTTLTMLLSQGIQLHIAELTNCFLLISHTWAQAYIISKAYVTTSM